MAKGTFDKSHAVQMLTVALEECQRQYTELKKTLEETKYLKYNKYFIFQMVKCPKHGESQYAAYDDHDCYKCGVDYRRNMRNKNNIKSFQAIRDLAQAADGDIFLTDAELEIINFYTPKEV
jgi:hypothetical protein